MTGEPGISNTGNILGDPKRSLIVMVVPIAIGMLVQALNNLVDAIWVSSLGTGALAATGVVFPFFFILVGIGNGLGVGASQAIARRIGVGDRAGASSVAAQVMVIGLVVGIAMTAVFALVAEQIFVAAGAGPYLEETLAYGIPIMVCSPIYMVSFIFSALLRSEGAAKKSMYIQVAGVAAHMVLDPILIFGLGMGITGAAVASAMAMVIASIMAVRYYTSGDMYVRFSFRGFRFDRELDRDILTVGIPASLETGLLSLSSMLMNLILESVDPVSGIAIYSSGWRILNILTMIAVSFGSALVPISAAAYGQGSYRRIREVYLFALKRGVAVMIAVAVLTEVAAPLLVTLFTYSESSAALADEMTHFLRICALFLPFYLIGVVTSSMFQSIGHGLWSLCVATLRNFMRIPLCFALSFTMSLTMVWCGITMGEVIASSIVTVAGFMVLRRLRRELGDDRSVQDSGPSNPL